MRWYLFIGLLFFLAFSVSAVNVNTCSTLNTANTYYTMTANASITSVFQGMNGQASCMNITASNITLDCNGFWISSNLANEVHAVNITNTSARVTGCTFFNFFRIMHLRGANDSIIINNTFLNNSQGISWPNAPGNPSSTNVTITNNFFNASGVSSGGQGAILLASTAHNLLNVSYNNFTYGGADEVNTNGSATILGNRIINNSKVSIYVVGGDNSNVTGNVVANSSYVPTAGSLVGGIVISTSANVNVSYNNVSQGTNGIYFTVGQTVLGSNNSFVAFNRVSFTNNTGIFIYNSSFANVSHNTIFNITNTSATAYANGIVVSSTNFNAIGSNVSYNTIDNVSSAGIYLSASENSSILGNVISYSSGYLVASGSSAAALLVTTSPYVNVSYNNISNGGLNGIYLLSGTTGSNYSRIFSNRVSFVSTSGIYVLNSIFVNASNNTVFNVTNTSNAISSIGIYFTIALGSSAGANVSDNVVSNVSSIGIALSGGSNSTISRNTITTVSDVPAPQGLKAGGIVTSNSQLLNVSYNTVSYAPIGVLLSRGSDASSGPNQSRAMYNTISFVNTSGIQVARGLAVNVSFNTISNVSNSTGGAFSAGISFSGVGSHSFNASYNVISSVSSNTTSAGIFTTDTTGAQNVYLLQNTLSNAGVGLNISGVAAGTVLYLNNISSSSAYGMLFNASTTSNVTQNYLTSAADQLMYVTANSSVVFTNTSINQSGLVFGDNSSNITVKWYKRILVTDRNGVALSGAAVTLSNSTADVLGTGTSDSSGLAINSLLIQEYYSNGSQVYGNNVTNANPFSVAAFLVGYDVLTDVVNFTNSENYTAVLSPSSGTGGGNNNNPIPTPTPSPTPTPAPSDISNPGYRLPPKTSPTPSSTPTLETVGENTPTPSTPPVSVNGVELSKQYALVLSETQQRISQAESSGKDVTEAKRLFALAKEAALKKNYSLALGYLNQAQSLLVAQSMPAPRTGGVDSQLVIIIAALLVLGMGYYYWKNKKSV